MPKDLYTITYILIIKNTKVFKTQSIIKGGLNFMVQLTTIEELTLKHCGEIQQYTKGLDLSYAGISGASKMLVNLYGARRDLDLLRDLNRKHPVIDKNTGKYLGELYDDEKIEGVMMATNIKVNSWIEACEGEIRRTTRKHLI